MRLGLIGDIHEAVEPLRAAVGELKARRVDAFVMLGDVLDYGDRVEETVAILSTLPGVGVWGNHDLGFCGEVAPEVRARYSSAAIDYFARLRPWVDLAGCRFQHVDLHLDPESLEDIWSFSTPEQRVAALARSTFTRVFTGHVHGWEVTIPEGQVTWQGEKPFVYRADQRYLTIVHAVVDGWCAVLDTEKDELEPVRVAAGFRRA